MKYLLVLCAVVGAALGRVDLQSDTQSVSDDTQSARDASSTLKSKEVVIERGHFTALLNHFNPVDTRKLRLAYQANLRYFKPNGPIFITGTNFGTQYITSGLVHDVARDIGGALITMDVRFEGENMWTNVTDEVYNFYTIDHMVADYPYLIKQLHKDLRSPHSKVVMWGLFAGGTIATSARRNYPNLVDGAWASSGMYRLFVPNPTHFTGTSQNIHKLFPACAKTLKHTLRDIVNLVKANNRQRLTELFSICPENNYANEFEAATFYETLFKWISFYIGSYEHMKDVCVSVGSGPNPLESFARWVEMRWDRNNNCRNISYAERLQRMRSWNLSYRGACTNLGGTFFVTSKDSDIFPDVLNVTFYEKLCHDVLGNVFSLKKLREATKRYELHHGSDIHLTSNTIFSVGGLDSIKDMGLNENELAEANVARNSWYIAARDHFSLTNRDSLDMYNSKLKIIAALREFAGFSEEE